MSAASREGRSAPAGGGAPVYRAAVLLSVGQVEEARALLATVPPKAKGKAALRRLISAVTLQDEDATFSPVTTSDWIAEAYFRQAHSDLDGALAAARKATALAPNSGFAFAVGDNTWHSVDPVGPEVKTRDLIILQYFVDSGLKRLLRNRGKRLGNLLLNEVRHLVG